MPLLFFLFSPGAFITGIVLGTLFRWIFGGSLVVIVGCILGFFFILRLLAVAANKLDKAIGRK